MHLTAQRYDKLTTYRFIQTKYQSDITGLEWTTERIFEVKQSLYSEQLFTCKIDGRNPPSRKNRSPTAGITPKWVNGLIDYFTQTTASKRERKGKVTSGGGRRGE